MFDYNTAKLISLKPRLHVLRPVLAGHLPTATTVGLTLTKVECHRQASLYVHSYELLKSTIVHTYPTHTHTQAQKCISNVVSGRTALVVFGDTKLRMSIANEVLGELLTITSMCVYCYDSILIGINYALEMSLAVAV